MKNLLYIILLSHLIACTNNKEEAKKLFKEGAQAYASGNMDKALGAFTQCIHLHPDMFDAYYNRGTIYLIREKYDLALIDFDACLKIKPTFHLAFYQKGIALQKTNQLTQAIEQYSQAITKDPVFKDAIYNRGWTYLELKDTNNACHDFNTCKDLGMTEAEKIINEVCKISAINP